jgi:hypothetical protein
MNEEDYQLHKLSHRLQALLDGRSIKVINQDGCWQIFKLENDEILLLTVGCCGEFTYQVYEHELINILCLNNDVWSLAE